MGKKSARKPASEASDAPAKPSNEGKRAADDVLNNVSGKKRKKHLLEVNGSEPKTKKTLMKQKDDNFMDEQELKDDSRAVNLDQAKLSAEINPIDSNSRLEDECCRVKSDAGVPRETLATENGNIDGSENICSKKKTCRRKRRKKQFKVPDDSRAVNLDQVKLSAEINPIDSNSRLEDECCRVKSDAGVPKETLATENGNIDGSENICSKKKTCRRKRRKKQFKVPDDSRAVNLDQVKLSAEINPIDSNSRLEDECCRVKSDAGVPKETLATENGNIDGSENICSKKKTCRRKRRKKQFKVPPTGTLSPIESNSIPSKDDDISKKECFEELSKIQDSKDDDTSKKECHEEPSKIQEVEKSITVSRENDSSEEVSSDEDIVSSSEEEEETDVKVAGLPTVAAKMAPIPKVQQAGSKTVFVGNLSFSVELADVKEFFEDAGEIVDVRLSVGSDGSSRGFGHVEFATAEEAVRAINELNGKNLAGRLVRLDFAKRESNTLSRGASRRIFVRGYKKDGEDQIKNALKDHFGSCGEITRISVPKVKDGEVKGSAWIEFKDHDACIQAQKFNGSEFHGATLTVEADRRDLHGRYNSGGRFGSERRGGRAERGCSRGGGRGGGRGGSIPQAKCGGS